MLHARGDVYRLPEIVLTVVEHHGQARTFVDADLQEEVLSPTLGVEMVHRLAHPQRGGNGAVWRRESSHHGIADRLDHGSSLRCDDLLQDAEVRPNEVEGDEVSDTLVKLGRSLQVGEQEGEARDLQTLVDGQRVSPEDIAEGLVCEKLLAGNEWSPMPQEIIERRSRDPQAR